MKILVALVALVALAGIVAAEDFPDWKMTNKLTYSYQQVLDSDESMAFQNGVTSNANFNTPLPLSKSDHAGYSSGYVSNTLVNSAVGTQTACDDPVKQTLTQTGLAGITFAADMDKEVNVYKMDGLVSKAQEFDVTGQITSLSASFQDQGYVGENYFGPFRNDACNGPLADCGNAWASETSNANGAVTSTMGSFMDEAWVGTSSSTGISIKVTDKLGAQAGEIMDGPFLSGTFDAYSGFEGYRATAYTTPVVTSASGSASHWLGYSGF